MRRLSILDVVLVCLTGFSGVSAQVLVSSLLVENKVAPIGIDVIPRFSWVTTSSARAVSQLSYQITVSNQRADAADVWDSGIVSSPNPYLAEYSGPALKSDTKYFWAVHVTTNGGSSSASSTFTTGLLAQEDWSPSAWIGKNTTDISASLSTAFRSASWIWTPEASPPIAPAADRAFRFTTNSPSGKTAASAVVVVTVDDRFTFYLNGAVVGASPNTPDIWKSAQVFRVALNSTNNVFAVRATNLPDPNNGQNSAAGLLAAVEVTFTDGSTTTFSSDTKWRATASIPENFQSPTLDDSKWANAASFATYGDGPWGTQVLISHPAPATPALTNSNWIWPTVDTPPGDVAFRKSFASLAGKSAASATILITVDNRFSLYLNGELVGASVGDGDIWKSAQLFRVTLKADVNVFAVRGTNFPDPSTGGASPAGLLAAISILYADASSDALVSDTTWKASRDVPAGFESPSFDDSAWASAVSFGLYGVGPWDRNVALADPLGEHPAPLLRKAFTITQPVAHARLYYAAGGYAAIALNGAPASSRVLSPGFTNYQTRAQYVALDVAALLTQGENVISAELGRSHYAVTQGTPWAWNSAPWVAEPSLRAVLAIGFADGTTRRIVSDASWRVEEGPTRLDDLFGGENYDASYIIPGYDKAGFDDSAWSVAQLMPGPAGILVNAPQPPTRVVESLTPIAITEPSPGVYVVAFERVVAGWAKISVQGPAKTLITIHFGEKLNTDGTVEYQDILNYFSNNFQTDRFWLAGTGARETFEPKFSYKGYQYLQIFGWPGAAPTKADVVGQVVHDDLALHGDFQCSDELLNKLHRASINTMLNNVHSIPTDCPTFEKNGWSGDAMVSAEMFLFNLDSADMLAKYAQDLHDTVHGGAPAVIAPDGGWGAGAFFGSPTWHSAFILIPAWIYQYRGDKRVLAQHYDTMRGYVEFELARSSNNIASSSLGDWVTPESSPAGGSNPPEDIRVPATAYLYTMFDTMHTVASILGKADDAATFASKAAAIKASYNNAFFNAAAGHYVGVNDEGYRQSHNLLSLAFGLTPNSSIQTVADSIAADVANRDMHLNTGALSTKQLLPVLTAHGHGDTAYALITQTTYPSWGFWIENGATSMWEHWKIEARSHDHMFLGTFEDWFYKDVLGIKSTSVAFQTVDISPSLINKIASASGWVLTPFGNLTMAYSANGGSLNINVGIPVGVKATVNFVVGTRLNEGGKAMEGSRGIAVLPALPGKPLRAAVGSGSYSFVAK